jgi:hypothetical protein
MGRDGRLHRSSRGLAIPQITGDECGIKAECTESLGIATDQRESGAVLGQLPTDRAAETTRRSDNKDAQTI